MSKAIGRLVVLSVFAFAIGGAPQAHAGAFVGPGFIDFNVPGQSISSGGGSISFAGGSSPLVGSNITVNMVSGGPLNSAAPFNCATCVLSFMTGNFDSMSNSFLGGGFISITGGFDPGDIPGGASLLSGTFTTATLGPTGPSTQLQASFNDTKHPDLLAFFGIPLGTPLNGGLNISFASVPGMSPGSFTSTSIGNSNVINTADTPSSLLLLGTGLSGLVYLRFRSRTQG